MSHIVKDGLSYDADAKYVQLGLSNSKHNDHIVKIIIYYHVRINNYSSLLMFKPNQINKKKKEWT